MDSVVSIIVPCYNVERFLSTCINSIQSQSYANWELILVDDGSPDSCGVLCDEYAKEDNRIKVIHKSNGGVASARNAGVKMANGDYICFVDGDDFLHPEFINRLLSLAIELKADIVQCGCIKGSDSIYPKIKTGRVRTYDNHAIFIKEVANIVLWGKLYKREVLDGIRIPEGVFYEDDFTTWKYYYRAQSIVVTTEPLYYYYQNPSSVMAQHKKKLNIVFIKAYEERTGFFAKIGEKDLEIMSHLQLLKGLVLSYSNPTATKEQKAIIVSRFAQSWRIIRCSSLIKFYYKCLFSFFSISPYMGSRLANQI